MYFGHTRFPQKTACGGFNLPHLLVNLRVQSAQMCVSSCERVVEKIQFLNAATDNTIAVAWSGTGHNSTDQQELGTAAIKILKSEQNVQMRNVVPASSTKS